MIVRGPRGLRGGAPVDWLNPISRSLVGAYIFDQSFPEVLFDSAHIAGDCFPTGSSTVLPLWGLDANRGAFAKFGKVSVGTHTFINTTYSLPTSDTTTVQIILTGTGLSGSTFGNRDSSGSSTVTRYQSHNPFSGVVYFDFGGATGNNRINYTPGGGYFGIWHVLVYTAGSTGMALYTDGVQSCSNGGAAVTRSNTAVGFAIGGAFDDPDHLSDVCQISLHLLWNRILTSAEIAAITRDPYQVFQQPAQISRVRYFVVPVVGGLLTHPGMDGNMKPQLLGGVNG